MNPLHSSAIALNNPQLSLAASVNLSTSTSALEPTSIQMSSNAHSPKSTVGQLTTTQPTVITGTTQSSNHAAFRLNLDSSEQIPILHQNGVTTTSSLHQSTSVHVPSAMSTSLHSGTSSGLTTAAFDAPNSTIWNSTSSLSPTMPTSNQQQHPKKCEVKLNAMP